MRIEKAHAEYQDDKLRFIIRGKIPVDFTSIKKETPSGHMDVIDHDNYTVIESIVLEAISPEVTIDTLRVVGCGLKQCSTDITLTVSLSGLEEGRLTDAIKQAHLK